MEIKEVEIFLNMMTRKIKNPKDSQNHEDIYTLQVVAIQCDHESLKLIYSNQQVEKITKLTMFEDPSFFTKESKGQSKNGDIPMHTKILDININNTYEFLKGNSMKMQVFLEDIKWKTHNNIPHNHYVFIYRIICRNKFE